MKKLTREEGIKKRLERGEKNFQNLDWSGLDLSNFNLSNTNLINTKLSHTNLSGANLHNADLIHADLSYADVQNADLSGATLDYAYLDSTDFRGALLKNTSMTEANLIGTLFDESEKIRKGIILKEKMIGYKKCGDGEIITLRIPKGAIVFSINNSQCRTNKAKVIDISNGEKSTASIYDDYFIYELGKTANVEDFDLRYNVECTTGIHFFRTKEEAENF